MKVMRSIVSAAAVCAVSFFAAFFGAFSTDAYADFNAEIPVSCSEGVNVGAGVYEIKIEPEDDVSPVSVSDTLKFYGNGTGHFSVNISEPGTYRYKVWEVKGNDTSIDYDSTVYTVMLFVVNDEDGGLDCTLTAGIEGKNTKPERIEFSNELLSAETTTITTSSQPVLSESTASAPETTTAAETVSSTDTEPLANDTTADDTTTKTAAEVTTTTAAATIKSDDTPKTVTGFIGSVLTGDTFPAHAVRITLTASVLTAVSTFLFKRKSREEEEENDE